MSESRQTHVTLHDIDPQALDQLVQFAYTAEIVVGEGNVQVRHAIPIPMSPEISSPDLCTLASPYLSPISSYSVLFWTPPVSPIFMPQTLLPAASLLQLNGVRDACCKFLLSQLDPSNCLGIRGFADTHSCSDLLKAAHRYVLQHFVDVAKTEEFMLLPLKQVTTEAGNMPVWAHPHPMHCPSRDPSSQCSAILISSFWCKFHPGHLLPTLFPSSHFTQSFVLDACLYHILGPLFPSL